MRCRDLEVFVDERLGHSEIEQPDPDDPARHHDSLQDKELWKTRTQSRFLRQGRRVTPTSLFQTSIRESRRHCGEEEPKDGQREREQPTPPQFPAC